MPNNPNRNSNWARYIELLRGGWAVIRAMIPFNSDLQELFTEDNPGQIAGDVQILTQGALVDDDNPFSVEQIVQAEGSWVEMMDVTLDADPTTFTSKPYHVDEESGVRVYIFIDSTLAPTNVRIVPEHSYNYDGEMPVGDAVWARFEEGLWASLVWEDVDTADGIWKNYMLPLAGEDWVRFVAIGAGTDGTNTFRVRIIVRAFKGPHAAAHA